MRTFRLVISCPDRVGIVAKVSNFLASHNGWITEASHHSDNQSGWFFMRHEIRADSLPFGIEAFREAWKEAGHERTPRVSVSRSIFAIMDDRDRAYFGRSGQDRDQVGFIDENTRAIFGRSYAAEPDKLVDELKQDEAVAEADTLLLTVPNQLGVAYNAHVIEAILKHVAPALGWR